MRPSALKVCVLLLGCGPRVEVGGDGTTTGTTTASTTEITSTTASSATNTTTSTSTTSTTSTTGDTSTNSESSSDDVDSVGFIIDVDGGGPWHECDPWKQNCPRGEKCSIASSNGGWWDSTRCTPIAEDANAVGEPCMVQGDGSEGIDDCALGAMCWDVHPDTGIGECLALCQGSEANPICHDACTFCNITSRGALILCIPHCDPLTQDCGDGEGCYPIVDVFACAPDVSGEAGGAGDVCEFINVCDPGLMCANPEWVPGCEGASCCTPFCDASAEDTCDALLPGTTCVPWFEEGQQPDTCLSGTVGFCGIAQ